MSSWVWTFAYKIICGIKLKRKFKNILVLKRTLKLNWFIKLFIKQNNFAKDILIHAWTKLYFIQLECKKVIWEIPDNLCKKKIYWKKKTLILLTTCFFVLSIRIKENFRRICCFFKVFANYLILNIAC